MSSGCNIDITVADMTNEGEKQEMGAEHSYAKGKGRHLSLYSFTGTFDYKTPQFQNGMAKGDF